MSIVALSRGKAHDFTKDLQNSIRLIAGLGVEGDAHAGVTVQHRSRVARDPTQPNLRQVHLIQAELFDELSKKGFAVAAGQLGENITTRGIDLLGLPVGARLHLGDHGHRADRRRGSARRCHPGGNAGSALSAVGSGLGGAKKKAPPSVVEGRGPFFA